PRVGSARAQRDRPQDRQHRRRDPDPAQRLPPAEAAPCLSPSPPCPSPSPQCSSPSLRSTNGQSVGCQVPPVPQGGREAVPQGGEMLYRQVRHRAPRLCVRPARPEERRPPLG